jgi:hypothetical protein
MTGVKKMYEINQELIKANLNAVDLIELNFNQALIPIKH